MKSSSRDCPYDPLTEPGWQAWELLVGAIRIGVERGMVAGAANRNEEEK